MEDRRNRGVGGFTLLTFVILLFAMFWLTNTLGERADMLSRKEFEELIASDQVQNVTVIQNKNVPTGRVEIELKAEEGERGEVKNYYVSDVNRIQEDLAEWDVDYELPNAPQDNWFTTTILPVLLMMAGVFFLFSMMNRQGGGANARAMSFGKSRAKLSTEKDKKITFAQVAGLKEEKEELEEILRISLEMRRRVKEQLKKLGGMEFYDVNFSYIDNETFEEFYVSVPEQGGGKLIPEGMCNPGQVYTVAQGKTGMLGVFRLESQMMPGNGKFERSGLGSDGKCKEATNTAFNFLKANSNRISGSISTTTKDYIINYQDLQGIGMTDKLALPTLIALSSVALGKPVASSLAVLGEISIAGTLIKVDELANSLQVCLDSGAKKVLLPIVSAADIGAVPSDLIGCFNLIFYQSAEDAVYKALGVE